MLAVQADGARRRDHRRPVGHRRDRATCSDDFHERNAAAVRLLHAGDADRGGRAAGAGPDAVAGGHPRAHVRQLLPLHRLSGDRGRRGGARCARASRRANAMSASRKVYIGAPLPRPNARRLLQGRGQYVDDMQLPRMVHAAFLRSPHAHARIVAHRRRGGRVRIPGVVRRADRRGRRRRSASPRSARSRTSRA